jgi:branched-chain amino acid transport system substrate-binding protein
VALVWLVCLALLSAPACTSSDAEETSEQEPVAPTIVKIGFVAPLTGKDSGPARDMRRAVELAVEDANNAAEAEESGYEFMVVSFDDEGDPDRAVEAAEALVSDTDVACVVGMYGTGCTVSAAAVYERASLPFITVCTSPRVTDGSIDVAHAIFPTFDAQAPVAAGVVREQLGIGHVVVLDDGSPYGQTLAEEFAESFEELGGAVDVRTSSETSPALVSSEAEEAAQGETRALYYAGDVVSSPQALAVREALGDDVPIVGADALHGPEYLETAENLYGDGAAAGDYCTDLGLPPELQPRGADFQVAYAARWGESPLVHAPYAYDAAWMVVHAVLESGMDRKRVEDALDSMEFEGVTGTVAFDEGGASDEQVVSVYQVVDDDWVLAQQ